MSMWPGKRGRVHAFSILWTWLSRSLKQTKKNLVLGPEFKLGHMGGTECCHHISTHACSPKKTERDLLKQEYLTFVSCIMQCPVKFDSYDSLSLSLPSTFQVFFQFGLLNALSLVTCFDHPSHFASDFWNTAPNLSWRVLFIMDNVYEGFRLSFISRLLLRYWSQRFECKVQVSIRR